MTDFLKIHEVGTSSIKVVMMMMMMRVRAVCSKRQGLPEKRQASKIPQDSIVSMRMRGPGVHLPYWI